MEPIQKIDIPNITIPQFGTNEVWLNGVPFVPSNHPSCNNSNWFSNCRDAGLCEDA